MITERTVSIINYQLSIINYQLSILRQAQRPGAGGQGVTVVMGTLFQALILNVSLGDRTMVSYYMAE